MQLRLTEYQLNVWMRSAIWEHSNQHQQQQPWQRNQSIKARSAFKVPTVGSRFRFLQRLRITMITWQWNIWPYYSC